MNQKTIKQICALRLKLKNVCPSVRHKNITTVTFQDEGMLKIKFLEFVKLIKYNILLLLEVSSALEFSKIRVC